MSMIPPNPLESSIYDTNLEQKEDQQTMIFEPIITEAPNESKD